VALETDPLSQRWLSNTLTQVKAQVLRCITLHSKVLQRRENSDAYDHERGGVKEGFGISSSLVPWMNHIAGSGSTGVDRCIDRVRPWNAGQRTRSSKFPYIKNHRSSLDNMGLG